MNSLVTSEPRPSMIAAMASRYGIEPDKFAATVKSTCLPANASNEEFAAFLMVAKEYDLNPILKEIYAFPKKGGGLQPIVSIDGWMNLINSHPNMDGIEFDDNLDKTGKLLSITCRIFRKDRSRSISVTEYMSECHRPTEPWQKWPARMLRHKAAIQAARYAFGFAGIIDPDEAERSPELISVTATIAPPPPMAATAIEKETVEEAADFEPTVFLEEIDAAMGIVWTVEDIEDVWTSFDVESRMQGFDAFRETADKIKARHLQRVDTAVSSSLNGG
jgi:phage recombination protein Bet